MLVLMLAVMLGAAVFAARQDGEDTEEIVERGRYLSTVVAGCGSCHTPQEDGVPIEDRIFSGHPAEAAAPQWDPSLAERGIGMIASDSGTAFAGPWGTSFASNLTPDEATGLGSWNENMFIREMRRGEFHPPMPTHLRSLSRSDLRAIWLFLQTLPPVSNRVPDFRRPRLEP